MEFVLLPAYGRDYQSCETLLADWNGGKDFQIQGGPYTSVRDLKMFPGEYVRLLYKQRTQWVTIQISTGEMI